MAKRVLVLSGASSVGKGAIRDLLLEDKDLDLRFVVSITTRPKKEKNGKEKAVGDPELWKTATESLENAIKASGKFLPWRVVTISTDGRLIED